MRVILDLDQKTITVPWNYTDKLAAMNRMIIVAMGDDAKELDFSRPAQSQQGLRRRGKELFAGRYYLYRPLIFRRRSMF